MNDGLSMIDRCHRGVPLGRAEVLVGDEVSCSVVVLDFVFRSDDVSVWFVDRTLAVMDRLHFASWIRDGGDYVVDDLAWTSDPTSSAAVTIDGRRTYTLDRSALDLLAARLEVDHRKAAEDED